MNCDIRYYRRDVNPRHEFQACGPLRMLAEMVAKWWASQMRALLH